MRNVLLSCLLITITKKLIADNYEQYHFVRHYLNEQRRFLTILTTSQITLLKLTEKLEQNQVRAKHQ